MFSGPDRGTQGSAPENVKTLMNKEIFIQRATQPRGWPLVKSRAIDTSLQTLSYVGTRVFGVLQSIFVPLYVSEVLKYCNAARWN